MLGSKSTLHLLSAYWANMFWVLQNNKISDLIINGGGLHQHFCWCKSLNLLKFQLMLEPKYILTTFQCISKGVFIISFFSFCQQCCFVAKSKFWFCLWFDFWATLRQAQGLVLTPSSGITPAIFRDHIVTRDQVRLWHKYSKYLNACTISPAPKIN